MNENVLKGVRDQVEKRPPTPPPMRTISGWSGETKKSKQAGQDWQDYMAGRELARLLGPAK